MSLARIRAAFRPNEIVDDRQLAELARWRLLDFAPEAQEEHVSQAPIIVVCGCGRSGTTLVRVMLDSHPAIYGGPEALVFLPLPIDAADLAAKFELDEGEVRALIATTGTRARFIDEFQRRLLRNAGKAVWADKTARNIHRLAYITRHFPRARIIHVVRDPRDVVASLKMHKRRKIEAGAIVPTGYCMPVELGIERWELAIEDALPWRADRRYREVRYEDLVTRPEDTMRALFQFLDVPFDDRILKFHEITGPTRDVRKFPQNIEATRPLSDAGVGRHRTVLTADEIAMVEARLAPHMETLGYRRSRPAGRPAAVPVNAEDSTPIKIVSARQVHEVIGHDPLQVKAWVREAFRLHHAERYIQPSKTYLVTTDNPYDRIISLPAAVMDEERTLGIKWIGSHSSNHERGLERAHAVIVLNDPITHATRVVMDGTLVSSLRTLAMSLIALDQFAARPLSVAILGMGKLGRMHAMLLPDLYPSLEEVRCFSRRAPFDDLLAEPRLRKCRSVEEALAGVEVVITASAATTPYIRPDHLGQSCRLVVNLSLMDCQPEVIAESAHVLVDDWFQNTRAERVFKQAVDRGLITRERVLEMGEVLFGPRRNYQGRVFVNPLGMGLEDIYVAGQVARRLKIYP